MNTPGNFEDDLWELHYGLLDEKTAAELRSRIASDKELAAAFESVKQQATLVAEAARLESPPVELRAPAAGVMAAVEAASHAGPAVSTSTAKQGTAHDAAQPAGRRRRGKSARPAWAKPLNALVLAAAGLLVAVSAYSYFGAGGLFKQRGIRQQLVDLRNERVRMVVAGPHELSPDAENTYHITATTVDGQPRVTPVKYRVVNTTGGVVLSGEQQTDYRGEAFIALPRGEVLGAGRLEIEGAAVAGKFVTPLKVEEIKRITHLSLDKPLYRPGETVFYRSLTLSRSGLRDNRELQVAFEVQGPSGAVVDGSQVQGYTHRGVGNGSFRIDPAYAGGTYTLVVRSPGKEFVEQRKNFMVRKYRAPRLKKELEFTRDSYKPGDTVVADFAASRAEGGAAAGAKLTVQVIVDGVQLSLDTPTATTSGSGAYQVQFKLPEEIENGDAVLSVTIDDGAARETISKPVPLNLGKFNVDFYPESGDLVAGLKNRVYFHAYDPQQKPVHIEGFIVDAQGTQLTQAKTLHEGRGRFSFKPVQDGAYTLVVKQPGAEEKRFDLPEVNKDRFLTLNTGSGIAGAGQPLKIELASTRNDVPLAVSVACRGSAIGRISHIIAKGKPAPLSLPLPASVAGVVRVTVYDYSVKPPKPLAERLVFRKPSQSLKVTATSVKKAYAPGDKVSVSVTVQNERNQPAPAAVLGLAAIDDTVLNLADDKSPQMQTYFWLTSEIKQPEDLEDANFFLGASPKAGAALDMLLGTQGWRRFVDKPAAKIRKGTPTGAELMAQAGAAAPALYDNLPQIRQQHQAAVVSLTQQRQSSIRLLGRLCFAGGAGLILVLVILSVFKLSAGVRYWAPALAAATLVIAAGAWWTTAEVRVNGDIALAGYQQTEPVNATVSADSSGPEELLHRKSRFDDNDVTFSLDNVYFGNNGVGLAYMDFGLPGSGAARHGWTLEKRELHRLVAPARQELALAELKDNQLFGQLRQEKARLQQPVQHLLQSGFGIIAPQRFANPQGLHAIETAMRLAAAGGDINKLMQLTKLYEQSYEKLKLPVRQYAHQYKPGDDPTVRSDFAETIYWNPLLITDENGQAKIEFELPASVTSFRLQAAAHGDGRLGQAASQIVSRIPFNIEPKMPLELTAGDTVELPVALSNDSGGKLDIELGMTHSGLFTSQLPAQTFTMPANARDRKFFSLKAGDNPGAAYVELTGKAGKLYDAVRREVVIKPAGFPVQQSFAGRLRGKRRIALRLPQQWTPGSLEASLSVFPTSLSQLQQGVEAILKEPHGCFEQTSSSNYPNILSLQYMQKHNIADPETTRRAKELLKKGYDKLISFESPEQGYEWFGGDPGHEALTAYGLMEFHDMSEVWEVDQKMVNRTAKWLLSRRDGKGGFLRNKRALDSFGRAPEEITNAYIVWALTEAGRKEVDKELEQTLQAASKSEDPYLVALAAGAAMNVKKHAPAGRKLLKRLAEMQAEDGHLTGANGSITRSGGHSLTVETTALCALAWLKHKAFAENADLAVQWLVNARQGNGGFGSTQATVLALKALVVFAEQNRRTTSAGEIVIRREGKVLDRRKFAAGEKGVIVMTSFVEGLQPGDNDLTIQISGDNNLPFALGVKHRTLQPANSDECPVKLATTLSANQAAAGETLTLDIQLTNVTAKGQPMTTAIIGIPAGLEANQKQLDELVEKAAVDYYELHGREISFYWRSLAPSARRNFTLPLIAEIPGSFTGPASRAYLYYTAEFKHWAEPLEVSITRK